MTDIQIILVESDEQTRIELRKGLRSQDGIEVASEATNGETGLVLLESIDVEVAVIDATLPDMSLADFIQRVRKVQADSYVTESKILVMVSDTQLPNLSDILAMGADYCCLKTIPIEQLAAAVRQTMAA